MVTWTAASPSCWPRRTPRSPVATGRRPASGFEEALRARASGEVLDGLAQALLLRRRVRRRHRARRAGHTRRSGSQAETLRAASCARFVGYLHGVVHGDGAVAGGWLSRAARLLESAGDCPERARFELTRAAGRHRTR